MADYYSRLESEYFDDPERQEEELERDRWLAAYVLSKKQRGRILEIGCGYGAFLSKFDTHAWDRHGVDPSPSASAYAREHYGLDVKTGSFGSGIYEPGSFDVVVMLDVIEHLHDPREVAMAARNVLKDDGLLVVGTGDISSIHARIARGLWGYFGSWEHISFFTPGSMAYLLDRAGFTAVEIRRRSHSGTRAQNLLGILRNLEIVGKNALKLGLNYAHRGSPYRYGKFVLAFDHLIAFAKPAQRSWVHRACASG
jgi:SAM-dependent methyltransferase